MYKCAIGQDSHRFDFTGDKPLILGGVNFSMRDPSLPALSANSDGDVLLHALTNAVSGITCRNILGKTADEMCRSGITDSKFYLKEALTDLNALGFKLTHISFSVECKIPKMSPYMDEIRESVSSVTGVPASSVGITATSGEGLTSFGKGEGIFATCIVTAEKK